MKVFSGWQQPKNLKWRCVKSPVHGAEQYQRAYVSALEGLAVTIGWEPGYGWHLAISHTERYPTWNEIRDARYDLLPDTCTMAMLLPPQAEYVNLHPNCFHLYEVNEETKHSATMKARQR